MSRSHTVRTRDGKTCKIDHYTRGIAIKAMCMECLGWDGTPMDCSAPKCPLFPFRGRTLKTQEGDA